MADTALDSPVRIFAREFVAIGRGIWVRSIIGIPLKGNGGPGDRWTFDKPLFQVVILRLPFNQAEPPAVIVNHDFDMIRIVEGRCTAIKRGIIEVPFWRSELPDELREIMPVFLIPFQAAFRGKVKLVPPLELILWWPRRLPRFLVADQITTHRNERLAAFGPECRHAVGRPCSPLKAGDDCLTDLKSIHQTNDSQTNHPLLPILNIP